MVGGDDMSARGGRGRGGGSGAATGAWRGSGERRGRGGRPGLYKVKDVSEDSRIDIEALLNVRGVWARIAVSGG